jgi:hypothetical protein
LAAALAGGDALDPAEHGIAIPTLFRRRHRTPNALRAVAQYDVPAVT